MTDYIKSRLTRRRLLAYACQLSLGALLTACTGTLPPQGSQMPNTTETAGKVATARSTATPKPTVTPKPTASRKLEGEIVVAVSTGSYKGWQTLADAYTKQNPSVRVVIELQSNDPTRDKFYREQIAAGAPRMSLANINTLSDLYAGQAFINWDNYLSLANPYTGSIWNAEFIPGCLDFGRSSSNEQYMLSTELFQVLCFYNRDLAKRLGLNPDKPPQTWDEMKTWVTVAADAGYVGIDLVENSDQIDWIARIYADSWYTTPAYWQLCACQRGDPCFDSTKPAFPSADWRTNVYFDDPDKVDFNPLRAWQALQDGYFLGDKDEFLVPMMEELRTVINKKTVPTNWRDASRSDPLLFYSSQALIVCAGSWFIASCAQAVQELQAGTFAKVAAGKATPTPDPQRDNVKSFNLGAFPLPRLANSAIQVEYQRTIEQPAGYWGVPRKTQRQNDLEVDFVMFITSPQMVAAKIAAELTSENAEGNIIGIPAIKGVTYSEQWASLFSGLHVQGNSQKPHPLNMVIGGLPSDVNERRRLMADFYDETIDAESLKSELGKLRAASQDAELAAYNLTLDTSKTPIEPSATP
jgi:raffinose/stachyose/melibiose transport system substrate-binding protein